jgi:hypoxanthine phosphoribosyltransferase
MDKILYSWSDFNSDISLIYSQIINSNIPDYIVGVKRGGLIPAIALSHHLNKPLIMMSCQLRDGRDNEVRLYEVEEISREKNILIVDDICDSGITLSKIMTKFISDGFNIDNIKTSALFYNTEQNFVVDYTGRTINRNIDQRWIIFPWEKTK